LVSEGKEVTEEEAQELVDIIKRAVPNRETYDPETTIRNKKIVAVRPDQPRHMPDFPGIDAVFKRAPYKITSLWETLTDEQKQKLKDYKGPDF
jgi:hypothetical protein